MKISELIEKLSNLKEKHGNLEIATDFTIYNSPPCQNMQGGEDCIVKAHIDDAKIVAVFIF